MEALAKEAENDEKEEQEAKKKEKKPEITPEQKAAIQKEQNAKEKAALAAIQEKLAPPPAPKPMPKPIKTAVKKEAPKAEEKPVAKKEEIPSPKPVAKAKQAPLSLVSVGPLHFDPKPTKSAVSQALAASTKQQILVESKPPGSNTAIQTKDIVTDVTQTPTAVQGSLNANADKLIEEA